MIDPVSHALHRRAGLQGPAMLMYHSITPGTKRPAWPWAVSMKQFCEQIDFLAREGYATPTMGELATPGRRWPRRTVVITFDDGYIDNLAACEALHARGMRATWFVVSGSVGRLPAWPADGRPAGRLLNAAELRAMQEAGMEIGSHTVSHVRLTEADRIRLGSELTQSKAGLEDLLGRQVDSFAYPYGAWDRRCADAVRDAGYAAACTTRTGWALRDNDPFLLRRLTIFNADTVGSLARKLYFGANDVRWRDIAHYAVRRARRT